MKVIENFLINHKERIVGLDILRCLAILIVVYGHGGMLIPEQYNATYFKFLFLKIDGVSIFFVLSGFLIGGILLRIIDKTDFTNKDLVNFWIRRWFRTIPNYLIVLFGILMVKMLTEHNLNGFTYKYLLFLQNFASQHPVFFPELWSLTIEEWFYLLFPLCCYFFHKILKNKSKSILISALIFLIFPLIFRIIKFENGIGIQDFDMEFRKIMILRLDSLMYGVIAAYILFKQSVFWSKSKYFFLTVGILLIILLNLNPLNWLNFYPPFYFNIESITTFCFLPFLSSYKTTKLKIIDSFVIFISIISYSMYLLNFTPVLKTLIPIINSFLGRKNLPVEEVYLSNYILYWFLTIIGSYLLYRFYENPITKLRDRIKIN